MREKKAIVVNILNFIDLELVGAAIFTRNLLSNWLTDEQSEVTLLHYKGLDVNKAFYVPSKSNIKTYGIELRSFVLRIFYEQLILPFKLRKYQIYFCPTPVIPFLAKLISPSTKIIITIHDMIPFHVPKKYGTLRSIYVKFISKYGARFCHHVVTVSENSKKDICEIAGIEETKVTVVYNFIDKPWVNNKCDKKYFLSISTIEPGKNIEGTLDGFKRFREKFNRSEYKFYWAGKVGWGYSAEKLNNLIASLNLQDSVVLTGFVNDGIKEELLDNCTCLVYLSHYEGFGLPVLEALLRNKPSIVANVSSLPEVIGEAGIQCDKSNPDSIANALEQMITQKNEYQDRIPAQLLKFDKANQISKFIILLNQ